MVGRKSHWSRLENTQTSKWDFYSSKLRNFIESIGKFVPDQKWLLLEKSLYEIEWLFVIAAAYWVGRSVGAGAENEKGEKCSRKKRAAVIDFEESPENFIIHVRN